MEYVTPPPDLIDGPLAQALGLDPPSLVVRIE